MLLKPQGNKIITWDGDWVISKSYCLVMIITTSPASMLSSCMLQHTLMKQKMTDVPPSAYQHIRWCSDYLCGLVSGSLLPLGRVLANSSSSIPATSLYIKSKLSASTYLENLSAVVERMGSDERICVVLTEWRFNFGSQPLYYVSAMFCEPLEAVSGQSYLSRLWKEDCQPFLMLPYH